MMQAEEEELVRDVAMAYAEAEAPEELEELEEDFDFILRELERSRDTRPVTGEGLRSGAAGGRLGIDSLLLDVDAMTAVVWLTAMVLREVVHARRFASVERELAKLQAEVRSLPARRSGRLPVQPQKIVELLMSRSRELLPLRWAAAGERLEPHAEDLELLAWLEPRRRLPDLVILVSEGSRQGRSFLVYHLKAADPELGLDLERFESERFETEPATFLAQRFREVEKLDPGREDDRGGAERRLAGMGLRLADELLPAELRRLLWRLRERVASVLLVSYESWIPWEALRLRAPGRGRFEGCFLGDAFDLTRWLRQLPLALELPLDRLAVVSAASAAREGQALARLGCEVVAVPARTAAVVRLLAEGGFDGWHFAGHGLAPEGDASGWRLSLEVGQSLGANDLYGGADRLGGARPMVFLNACHSGAGGLALTGAGGAAVDFLEAGAAAFVGAHWAVRDGAAHRFARSFYEAFLSGVPLGAAARRARRCLGEERPGEPTRLAYAVYGHPLATRPRESTLRGVIHRGEEAS